MEMRKSIFETMTVLFCYVFGIHSFSLAQIEQLELGENSSQNNSFVLHIPVSYNRDSCTISIVCERYKDNSVDVVDVSGTRLLPKEFYKVFHDNFGLGDEIMHSLDYDSAYNYYKKQDFIDTNFVSYQKESRKCFRSKSIYIIDIDHDGLDDVLLLNLQESMRDNNTYEMFKGTKDNIVYKRNFFQNRAFLGWDETKEYLITGVSDTKKRRLYKNRIKHTRLIVIDKCIEYAVSEEYCW